MRTLPRVKLQTDVPGVRDRILITDEDGGAIAVADTVVVDGENYEPDLQSATYEDVEIGVVEGRETVTVVVNTLYLPDDYWE